jgi:hypothetical protein
LGHAFHLICAHPHLKFSERVAKLGDLKKMAKIMGFSDISRREKAIY